MKTKSEYSDKERALLSHFGMAQYFDNPDLRPPWVYRQAAFHAFLDDYVESPETISLRRCCLALNNCTVNRGTPEWDDLIRL